MSVSSTGHNWSGLRVADRLWLRRLCGSTGVVPGGARAVGGAAEGDVAIAHCRTRRWASAEWCPECGFERTCTTVAGTGTALCQRWRRAWVSAGGRVVAGAVLPRGVHVAARVECVDRLQRAQPVALLGLLFDATRDAVNVRRTSWGTVGSRWCCTRGQLLRSHYPCTG